MLDHGRAGTLRSLLTDTLLAIIDFAEPEAAIFLIQVRHQPRWLALHYS